MWTGVISCDSESEPPHRALVDSLDDCSCSPPDPCLARRSYIPLICVCVALAPLPPLPIFPQPSALLAFGLGDDSESSDDGGGGNAASSGYVPVWLRNATLIPDDTYTEVRFAVWRAPLSV